MNSLKKILTGAALLLSAATAQSASVTVQDIYDPADFILGSGSSHSFQHSILDQGFDPSKDSILDVDLSLYLKDDGDYDYNRTSWRYSCSYSRWRGTRCYSYPYTYYYGQPEYAQVYADGNLYGSFEVDYFSMNYSIDLSSLSDGLLDVTVKNSRGDFYFGKSILDVEFENLSPVPVPAAAWLFGSALLGFAGFSRHRKNKSA